jgi:uncharacterized protein (DUF1778 family)
MQLEPHVLAVREQLTAAAALGDDRTRQIAQGLGSASSSAVRLALVAAITEASAEITTALLDFPGSPAVAVRLDSDAIGFEIRGLPPEPEGENARRDDGESTARISLRLPEGLKAEIDAAADAEGVSVNTWLVRAAATAVRRGTPPFSSGGRGHRGDQRITGWING